MKKVVTVIVNYHREELTERAIASVLSSQGIRPSVVLIDNASDGLWIQRHWAGHTQVHTIVNERNIGFGAACNQGIDQAMEADADAMFLLNNDAHVASDTLALLAEAACASRGAAAPLITLPDGRLYSAGGWVELNRARAGNRGIYATDPQPYLHPERLEFASACALMLSREALASGLRFDPSFFLYYEDVDLCLRLTRGGYPIAFVPQARVVHEESASTGSAGIGLLDYFNARNRYALLARHGRRGQRAEGGLYWLVTILVRAIGFAVQRRPDRMLSVLSGLRDGLRGHMGPGPYIKD